MDQLRARERERFLREAPAAPHRRAPRRLSLSSVCVSVCVCVCRMCVCASAPRVWGGIIGAAARRRAEIWCEKIVTRETNLKLCDPAQRNNGNNICASVSKSRLRVRRMRSRLLRRSLCRAAAF